MASLLGLRSCTQTSTTRQLTATPSILKSTIFLPAPLIRPFHSTPASQKKKGSANVTENTAKVRILKENLFSSAPPPLRMGRNRALRHWTIHRAWQLYQRKLRVAKEKEMLRMHQSMYNACEELRETEGPGNKGKGYLYRVAMEKRGVYGREGIPIEYSRYQTETPAKLAWDHDWKR